MTHVRNIGLAALLSFVAAGVGSVIWGALLITNARTSLWVPWSAPVMAGVLVAYWLYLGGRGWPRSTSGKRRELLRARLVPAHIFAWAWAAGGLALVALAGLWIVLVELTGNGGNPTESLLAGYPTVIVVLAIAMGSLVSPLTEEASFRGYAQVLLERHYAPVIAVALSSVLFSVWHGPTQGFFWSKLLFFFAVGVDPRSRSVPTEDGSALERAAAILALPLEDAIEHCRSGAIRDAKTELALRRLAETA